MYSVEIHLHDGGVLVYENLNFVDVVSLSCKYDHSYKSFVIFYEEV